MGLFDDKERILTEAKYAEQRRIRMMHEQHLAKNETYGAMKIFVNENLPVILQDYIHVAQDNQKKIFEIRGIETDAYYIGSTIYNLYNNSYAGWFISEKMDCCKVADIMEMSELKYYFLAILPYVYGTRDPLSYYSKIDEMVDSMNVKFKEYLIKLIYEKDNIINRI